MPMSEKTAYLAMDAHFATPGVERSVDVNGDCFYRKFWDDDGNPIATPQKCAFGVLIPDDIYDEVGEDIEGMSASAAVQKCPQLEALLEEGFRLDYLDELQYAHDNAPNVYNCRLRLKEVARRHGVIED